MTLTLSSQDFVRALKAASDPPQPGSLYKIDIAQRAWDDVTFCVPGKAEVIAEWILARLLKDRANDSEMRPIVDLRLWTLLSDVLSTSRLSTSVLDSRSVKTWLVALLNRIPIAPIIISFLEMLASLEAEYRKRLTLVVRQCIAVIWPPGVQKLSGDVLLDCVGALQRVFKLCETDESLSHIGIAIISSFRSSLGNSSNKKLYVTFIQAHLQTWMECVLAQPSCPIHGTLIENSYAAGVETMFSLDILRQTNDVKTENTLFDAFGDINTELVISVLPKIFGSFLQYIKKYRSPLFSRGISHPAAASEEVRAAGMRFFVSCQNLLCEVSNEHTWSTRVALLNLVDKENLFSRHQTDAEITLKQNVEVAIAVLGCSWNVDQIEVLTLAVETLSALARIDYDFIVPLESRILPQLLLVSQPNSSFLAFLDLLLSYHAKTRTLHTYIINLLTAVSSDSPSAFSEGSSSLYQLSSSGPLLHPTHLDRLGKCIQNFFTSSQTPTIVHHVLLSLKNIWERFHSIEAQYSTVGEQGSRKRRKTDAKAEELTHSEILAVKFSSSARVVSVVLSSLPLRSAAEAEREEIQSLLKETQTTFLHPILTKSFKAIQRHNSANAWASQIVAVAALRLRDILNAPGRANFQWYHDSELSFTMLQAVEDEAILPEFGLEILCTLLSSSAAGHLPDPQTAFLRVLDYLDRNLTISDITRLRLPCRLTFGQLGNRECASSLLHMIIEKWLPAFEAFASQSQLDKLVQLIFRIRTSDLPLSRQHETNSLLTHTLRSAQFWELPKLRNSVLAFVIKETRTVDETHVSGPNPHDSQIVPVLVDQIRHTIAAFELLLFFPTEYLSRTIKMELIKRAWTTDILLCDLRVNEEESSDYFYHSLVTLRVFLRRICESVGSGDQSTTSMLEFLEHMLNAIQPFMSPTEEFSSATLDLVELYLSALFKSSEESSALKILATMCSFLECNPFQSSSSQATIRLLSLVRLIALLTNAFSLSKFSDDIQAAMRDLYDRLQSTLLPLVCAIVAEQTTTDIIISQRTILNLWRHTLALGRWQGLKPPDHLFGQRLATQVLAAWATVSLHKNGAWDDISSTTLAILLQEFHCCADYHRHSHLDIVVAVYVAFCRIVAPNGQIQMDDHIAKACRLLSTSDFSHLLEFVSESMSDIRSSPTDLTNLVHLSVVLLHDRPDSTLKVIQTFTTKCINMFASHSVFTGGPVDLRLQSLRFVTQHCSDRPAALRLGDLGGIWSLLSKVSAKSETHDETTSTTIFQEIITIISTLVRLRRDIVALTLPHLGMVLRQLMMCIRSPRPHLGGKQSAFVADTFPQWVNVHQPLDAEAGKALSRLLETLTTKNITRTHAPSSETQKAESLAKPFSKHAAYVLKAYTDALNDPLCILPPELRKEMQPGLFALCNMLTEHSRDAMMVSALDAAGKVTMKTIWKEYEKQRYVGKG